MRKNVKRCATDYSIKVCFKCGFRATFRKGEFITSSCKACNTKLWMDALENMPWTHTIPSKHFRLGYKRGRATALRMCLGYHVYSGKGRSNAQCAVYNAMQRGSSPREPHRQALLAAYAGPQGAIVARIKLTAISQAQRFRYWP